MITISNSLESISGTSNLRMGLAYAKEIHAPFFSKYSSDCSVRLKEICDIEKGKNITEDDATPGSIPVVAGGKTFAYYHDTYNREGNIITVSASGASSGFVNYWEQPIWASDCITVRSKDENLYITKFIYYLLKLIQSDIHLLQKGADQPHVYPDDIGAILMPDISVDLQKSAIFKIESYEKQIADYGKQLNNIQIIIE